MNDFISKYVGEFLDKYAAIVLPLILWFVASNAALYNYGIVFSDEQSVDKTALLRDAGLYMNRVANDSNYFVFGVSPIDRGAQEQRLVLHALDSEMRRSRPQYSLIIPGAAMLLFGLGCTGLSLLQAYKSKASTSIFFKMGLIARKCSIGGSMLLLFMFVPWDLLW